MAKLTIEILGAKELQANLARIRGGTAAEQALATYLYQESETKVIRVAKDRCPVVTSALKNSGHTKPPVIEPPRVYVIAGFGGAAAPYARAVHENPRAGRTGGYSPSGKKYYPRPGKPVPYSTVGQWKFLESAYLEWLPTARVGVRTTANFIFRREMTH